MTANPTWVPRTAGGCAPGARWPGRRCPFGHSASCVARCARASCRVLAVSLSRLEGRSVLPCVGRLGWRGPCGPMGCVGSRRASTPTARARPTRGPHTRASAIAPLRAGPAAGGRGRARRAEGTRASRNSPRRGKGRKNNNNKSHIKSNQTRGGQGPRWRRPGRLQLPRADDGRGARPGPGAVRPGARGSYGDGERGPRRRLTGVGPGGGGGHDGDAEQHVRQGRQGLGGALRQPGPREVSGRGARSAMGSEPTATGHQPGSARAGARDLRGRARPEGREIWVGTADP